MRQIRYGSCEVEVIERQWRTGGRVPYKKTYSLIPGQSWFDAEETPDQWEHYVVRDDGHQVPVGVLIAQELKDEGATEACFVELWGGCILVNEELVCVHQEGAIGKVLDTVKDANEGKLGGFPDVVAVFPDGRIAFREAKNLNSKDRLGEKQHRMADLLRGCFPNIDIKVVEWSFKSESK